MLRVNLACMSPKRTTTAVTSSAGWAFFWITLEVGKRVSGWQNPIERVEKTPYSMTLEDYFADLSKKGTLEKYVIEGVDFYRAHRINDTLWPDFVFRGDASDDDGDENANQVPPCSKRRALRLEAEQTPRWDEHRRVRRSK